MAVAAGGPVQRWIEILSPTTGASETAQTTVECQELQIWITGVQRQYTTSGCAPGNGAGVILSAVIEVNGPARVEYRWEIGNGDGRRFVVPGAFEMIGTGTHAISHAVPSSAFTASSMQVRLKITSHDAQDRVVGFSPMACPSA